MRLIQELPLVARARQLRHTFVQGADEKHYKILTFKLYDFKSPPEFATHDARSQNYKSAYAMVAEEMLKRTSAFWLEALEKGDIPVQRMNSIDDIVADPHLKAIGYLKTVEHPSEGRIRMLAPPSEWSETPPEYRRHAPRLGEHTREVLKEGGLTEQTIQALLDSGAAKQAPL